ncbi:hypothetical protein KIPB_014425, partial [Kipferlia bialata]|eukprot:g14425.t1
MHPTILHLCVLCLVGAALCLSCDTEWQSPRGFHNIYCVSVSDLALDEARGDYLPVTLSISLPSAAIVDRHEMHRVLYSYREVQDVLLIGGSIDDIEGPICEGGAEPNAPDSVDILVTLTGPVTLEIPIHT